MKPTNNPNTWREVALELPAPYVPVLVLTRPHGYFVGYRDVRGRWYYELSAAPARYEVDLWAPLPPLPANKVATPDRQRLQPRDTKDATH